MASTPRRKGIAMFEDNPCLQNPFEVFRIDRSETDLRAIRERVKDARETWEFDGRKIKTRGGAELAVDEAHMNEFQARLFDPLCRLKEEQFVHQAHSFAGDSELSQAVGEFLAPAEAAALPGGDRAAVLKVLAARVPPIPAPHLADDLPWPAWPEPFQVETETLEAAILRDF